MKAEILVNLMNLAWKELERFAAELNENERNAVGAPDNWSAKDVVGHLGTWQGRLVDEIEAVESEGKLPEWGELEAANLEIYKQNEHKSWEEVWDDTKRNNQIAIARTAIVKDEVLDIQVQDGRTFGRVIFGNSFIHWIDHILNCYLDRGNVAGAERLIEMEVRELEGFDPSPRILAVGRYNQACFYSKTKQVEKAVSLLRQVFQVRPDLMDWARQDNDLVNLHGVKTYEDLFSAN